MKFHQGKVFLFIDREVKKVSTSVSAESRKQLHFATPNNSVTGFVCAKILMENLVNTSGLVVVGTESDEGKI